MKSIMRQPLVSIVMPTYNHAKFIGEAIESALNQTYKNFELIIIDNYSEDDTEKIVASYKDDRIKYLKFRNNGIIAASRNYGIKNSNGEYIAFLDSDDIWLPQKIELQIDQLESNSENGLSYVLYSCLLNDGSIKGIFPTKKLRGNIFNYLYIRSVIANSGVMVRRKVFDELGLLDENPDLVAAEDLDMWLRIARSRPIDYVDDKPLLIFRVRDDSISKGLLGQWRRMMFIAKRYAPYAGMRSYIRVILLTPVYLIRTKINIWILQRDK